MKNFIASLATISLLLSSLSAQASDSKSTASDALLTLAGAGILIGAVEQFGSAAELPIVYRATAHVSALLYAAGRLTKDDSWKERALKFPLAVATLQITSTELVQSGNDYIPFFGEALKKMPKEALVGLETLIFYMHGTDEIFKMYKKDIHKAMGWKIDAQVD